MYDATFLLLVVGALVLASVLASRVSDRIGVPALIVFLAVGMLAGSDGPGGIEFDNARLANLVGMVALAMILFSGGLDTDWRYIRPVAGRGIVLSTLGVVITAGLVGLFAWSVLGFPLMTGLLLGSIVSSTDAAAVFSILRRRDVSLKGNLKPLLELESGSNDPVAIFLTVSFTHALTQPDFNWATVGPGFAWNMAGGVVFGLASGKAAGYVFNKINLGYEGLYPVLSVSWVLLTFGLSETLRGNGYLAVYICGILLNGTDFRYRRYVLKFHDGVAWLSQIVLFLVLGLLVFPSQLPKVVFTALPVAVFLMLVARPIAVAAGLIGSPFPWRERTLAAWTGLRGAVPIVLATYPLMAGYKNSDMVFNVVFFTVLTSVMVQGTLLMPVARALNVDEPMAARPRYSLEIERAGQAQGDTREFEILPNMGAVGRTVADLDIPPDVLILLIGRGNGFVVPRGQTRIEPYDTLLMIGDPAALRTAGAQLASPRPSLRSANVLEDPLAMLPNTTGQEFLSKQVVVVGYGRVGRRICNALSAHKVPYVVLDQNRDIVKRLRDRGVAAVSGDAATAMALAQAHIARAAVMVVATPDALKVRTMVEFARKLNPSIHVVIRSHSEMDASLLRREGAGTVFIGEEVLANSITDFVLRSVGPKQTGPGANTS